MLIHDSASKYISMLTVNTGLQLGLLKQKYTQIYNKALILMQYNCYSWNELYMIRIIATEVIRGRIFNKDLKLMACFSFQIAKAARVHTVSFFIMS